VGDAISQMRRWPAAETDQRADAAIERLDQELEQLP
jgi:hypothetical protein